MRKILIVLSVAVLFIIVAVVGLSYALMELSKDTKIQGQVQVDKSTGHPVGTVAVKYTRGLHDAWQSSSLDDVSSLTTIKVPYGDNRGMAQFFVRSLRLEPGKRLEIETMTDGVEIIID